MLAKRGKILYNRMRVMRVTFVYEPALLEHMAKKGLTTVCVEVVTANADIDYTEIYVHLVKPSQADEFKTRKKYRAVATEHGEVLLPPYHLEYDETVTFGLRKLWIFRSVKAEGIRL